MRLSHLFTTGAVLLGAKAVLAQPNVRVDAELCREDFNTNIHIFDNLTVEAISVAPIPADVRHWSLYQ